MDAKKTVANPSQMNNPQEDCGDDIVASALNEEQDDLLLLSKPQSIPTNPLIDSSDIERDSTSKSASKKANDSDNIVTAATTSTARTSSYSLECNATPPTTSATASSGSGGDDDDLERSCSCTESAVCGDMIANVSGNGNYNDNEGQDRSNHDRHEKHEDNVLTSTNRDGPPPRKKLHHELDSHHQESWSYATSTSRTLSDDGSTLKVPGDDGAGQIVASDIEGGAPIQPATVLASRLFTHTTSSFSSPSSTAGDSERGSLSQTKQNQHHLLLPPHREPGYHTIRNTLYRFNSSDTNSNTRRSNRSKKHRASHHHHRDRGSGSSSNPITLNNKHKRNKKRLASSRSSSAAATGSTEAKESTQPSPDSSLFREGHAGGSSSGSGTDGTEDGYAASVSSNENGSRNQLGSSSPSPSVTSSEECEREQQAGRLEAKSHLHNSCKRKSAPSTQQEQAEDQDSSSEIADFSSSGISETMDEEDDVGGRGDEASLSLSNHSDSDGLEMSYLSAKRAADSEHERIFKTFARRKKSKTAHMPGNVAKPLASQTNLKRLTVKNLEDSRPTILALGCDIMAHILTFLQPPEILDILTMPLSKYWRQNFTSQPELWRVLCLVEPFKATIDDHISSSRSNNSSSDETYQAIKTSDDTDNHLLDMYRLLYTSFVRCMKYLSQIRDDAINGRPPAYIDYGVSGRTMSGAPEMYPSNNVNRRASMSSSSPPPPTTLGSNRNLQFFLAQAMDVVLPSSNNDSNTTEEETKDDGAATKQRTFQRLTTAARVGAAHRKADRMEKNKIQEKKNGLKFGRSMITSRLLVSPGEGQSNLNLPWSCAIYSIVNWMVAFSDVEGIQTLCLKVLPDLLENEQHRLTAQHAGLADVVLRAMVMFSESAQLHIAAFHTVVLLARPHGGSEGMMFRTTMTADGIFRGIYQQHGKSGIAVMLDSMRRFQDNAPLLAMSCWALVNIALVSDQKAVLVKLGGIQAITNAMYRHPFSAELQFRALFALINLVIPSVQELENNDGDNNGNGNANANDGESAAAAVPSEPEQLGELNETTEREIIDELVGDIASLVVRVMKNFCSSEAILNRACLVLHNLSLTEDYHVILLWTPQCYQMLEWCIANFRTDQVLQQSATGTLHRLQSTLASDEEMRIRFSKSLRTQQQLMTLKQSRDVVR